MSIFFFNTFKNKKFNYKPIYYDEVNERIEELKKKSKGEYSYDREKLKESLKSRWRKGNSEGTNQNKTLTMIKLAIVLGLVMMIIYYIIKNFFELLY